MTLTPEQARILDDRRRLAGYDTIEEYCWALRAGLVKIADQPSGIWGRMANETLHGHRIVDRASTAVAQRGHDQLDEQMHDALSHDALPGQISIDDHLP